VQSIQIMVTCLFVEQNIRAWCKPLIVNFVKKCWCWDDLESRQSDICVHCRYQFYKGMVVSSWWGARNYQNHVSSFAFQNTCQWKETLDEIYIIYLFNLILNFDIFVWRNFGRFGSEVALHSRLSNVTILHLIQTSRTWVIVSTVSIPPKMLSTKPNMVGII
jgi:hypothetical protein